MNTLQKLDYVRGKLGLLPAFGDSIGLAVNKAELGLCGRYAADAVAVHRETVSALENALRLLGDIKTRAESHAFLQGATQPANIAAIHELARDAAAPARVAIERADADVVPNYPMAKPARVSIGAELQTFPDGESGWNWFVCTVDDGNDEPVAGGYCATEADALNDARVWVRMNPQHVIGGCGR